MTIFSFAETNKENKKIDHEYDNDNDFETKTETE